MNILTGSCHCMNVQFNFITNLSPSTISPRECDCDFCIKNNVAYISDPEGSLKFTIKDKNIISKVRQGSETAEFLQCSCGSVIAALFLDQGQIFASVNANLINQKTSFAEKVRASPKTLSPEQKVERWKSLWIKHVTNCP